MSADDDSTVSVCRFCLERGDCNNVLLNGICECKGTSAYVHLSCLRSWQESCALSSRPSHEVNANKCPVCKSQYVNVELFSRVSFLEERVGSVLRAALLRSAAHCHCSPFA